jgi:hypothetical protein
VSALTTPASSPLWDPWFSPIRGWLLGHMAWMISDATGVGPGDAKAAGFVQDTYGAFTGVFHGGDLKPTRKWQAAFVALFASQPRRPLPFRFGYPDASGHYQLVVTRRP